MKFTLTTTKYGDIREYKHLLEKYKIVSHKTVYSEDLSVTVNYLEIDNLNDLMLFIKDVGGRVVIDFNNDEVELEIYDYERE